MLILSKNQFSILLVVLFFSSQFISVLIFIISLEQIDICCLSPATYHQQLLITRRNLSTVYCFLVSGLLRKIHCSEVLDITMLYSNRGDRVRSALVVGIGLLFIFIASGFLPAAVGLSYSPIHLSYAPERKLCPLPSGNR